MLNKSVPDFVRENMGIALSELKEKPTFLYNTWEPFDVNVNEKLIMELAKAAAGAVAGGREAVTRYSVWSHHWRLEEPGAVRCLEEDLDELLNFLSCPKSHWKKIRTTNAIERAFREVRRRTRPMTCFQNSASVDRIIYGVISHLNKNWEKKPLPEFTHNT